MWVWSPHSDATIEGEVGMSFEKNSVFAEEIEEKKEPKRSTRSGPPSKDQTESLDDLVNNDRNDRERPRIKTW